LLLNLELGSNPCALSSNSANNSQNGFHSVSSTSLLLIPATSGHKFSQRTEADAVFLPLISSSRIKISNEPTTCNLTLVLFSRLETTSNYRCRAMISPHCINSLYTKGRILGHKRGKRNSRPNQSLIQIEGVDSKEATRSYLGKVSSIILCSVRRWDGGHDLGVIERCSAVGWQRAMQFCFGRLILWASLNDSPLDSVPICSKHTSNSDISAGH